jgi:dienelactone hydrolase
VFRWIDASRGETATADPSDLRNVIVQAWYPTTRGAPGRHSTYIDGLGRLPPSVSGVPSFIMARYGQIDTHAALDAPLSTARPAWPVVLFSPGYGAPRAAYTDLVSRLASRGYVVLSLDHPYEAGVTQLADGRVVGTSDHRPPDNGGVGYMERQILVRLADLGFVLDQLARPGAAGPVLDGRLDLDHVAAIGHSFGGATSVLAAQQDARIKASADIDGGLYANVWTRRVPTPFLLLESDHGKEHDARYMARTAALLARLDAGGGRFEITRADHLGLTDASLHASPPGRLASGWLVGGPRDPSQTHAATVDILDAFLRGPLGGPAGDLGAAAKRYPGIVGGPL